MPGRSGRKPPADVSPGLRQWAVAAYGTGATVREIAQVAGVDNTTVSDWLTRSQAPTRRRGPRGAVHVSTDTIIALREQGLSFAAIASRVGMSPTGVKIRYRTAVGDRPSWLVPGASADGVTRGADTQQHNPDDQKDDADGDEDRDADDVSDDQEYGA